jgi:hypothetical protein
VPEKSGNFFSELNKNTRHFSGGCEETPENLAT